MSLEPRTHRGAADAPGEEVPGPERVHERVEELVLRGLERYGTGDLSGALGEWEHALTLDPGAHRAQEYIDYVRENFEELDQEFRSAGEVAASAAAAGVPLPEGAGGGDDDAYDVIELELEGGARPLTREDAPIDEGWQLDELAAPLPPPPTLYSPPTRAAVVDDRFEEIQVTVRRKEPLGELGGKADPEPIVRLADLPPGAFNSALFEFGELPRPELVDAQTESAALRLGTGPVGKPVSAAELGLSEDDTGESTSPAGRRRAVSLVEQQLSHEEPAHFAEDLSTVDRFGPGGGDGALAGVGADLGLEFDPGIDVPEPRADDSEDGSATTRKSPIMRRVPQVIVDQSLLSSGEDSGLTAVRGSSIVPADESVEDRIRRRVTEALRLAGEAADRADLSGAVEAAERALSEDPEGIVAPVILHRHRDLLYRIYELYLGDVTQVPQVFAPLHEITADHLDHREGFLLSRIDGALSFEDILDIAAMPRLDALRILANLLRRGLIAVR
jgi:hypothetical protein